MISISHSQTVALYEILKILQASKDTKLNIRIIRNNYDLVVTLLKPRTTLTISRSGRVVYTVKEDKDVEELVFEGESAPEHIPMIEHSEITADAVLGFQQIELIKVLFELGLTVSEINTNMPKKALQKMVLEKLGIEIPAELSE